jgi:hypothetical protein
VQSAIQGVQYCPSCHLKLKILFEEKVCVHTWAENQEDQSLQTCTICHMLREKLMEDLLYQSCRHAWQPSECSDFDCCSSCKTFRHHDSSLKQIRPCVECSREGPLMEVDKLYTHIFHHYCPKCGKIYSIKNFFENLKSRPHFHHTPPPTAKPAPTQMASPLATASPLAPELAPPLSAAASSPANKTLRPSEIVRNFFRRDKKSSTG